MALERLEFNYYRVTIGALTGGVAPANGHVDSKTPEQYIAAGDGPTTLDNSLAKERANMRWEAVLRQVSENIQPVFIADIVTDADGNTAATSFAFTLAYDRVEYLRTEDENNVGTFLTGANAIKRWVERALTTSITQNRQIYDPTQGVDSSAVTNGPQIIEVTAGAAEAALPIATVAVTEVANLTPTF